MMDKQNKWVSMKLLVSDCVITGVRVSTKTCQTRATLLMFVKLIRIFFSLTSFFCYDIVLRTLYIYNYNTAYYYKVNISKTSITYIVLQNDYRNIDSALYIHLQSYNNEISFLKKLAQRINRGTLVLPSKSRKRTSVPVLYRRIKYTYGFGCV